MNANIVFLIKILLQVRNQAFLYRAMVDEFMYIVHIHEKQNYPFLDLNYYWKSLVDASLFHPIRIFKKFSLFLSHQMRYLSLSRWKKLLLFICINNFYIVKLQKYGILRKTLLPLHVFCQPLLYKYTRKTMEAKLF